MGRMGDFRSARAIRKTAPKVLTVAYATVLLMSRRSTHPVAGWLNWVMYSIPKIMVYGKQNLVYNNVRWI